MLQKKYNKQRLFDLGRVDATRGAVRALEDAQHTVFDFLFRHLTGDWGEVDEEDAAANDRCVKKGCRLLSSYKTKKGVKLWVITEWDRSATTLLLPEEY